MALVQVPPCGRGLGSQGATCSCSACKPPTKIFARGHLLFSAAQEGSCFTAEVEYDLLRIRELERAAEMMARKLRIVSPVGFTFLSSVVPRHYSRSRAFVESLASGDDELSLDNKTLFPPLVGLGDGEEWVEFESADECSDCDVISVGEEEGGWTLAGVSVTDRLKPSPALQSAALDFKRALLTPAPAPSARRHEGSKSCGGRSARALCSPRIVLQALWRDDMLAEDDDTEDDGASSDEDDWRAAATWGRQFGGVRKSRSHVMARLLAEALARKARQRQFQVQVVAEPGTQPAVRVPQHRFQVV